jgi:hypothetical protein
MWRHYAAAFAPVWFKPRVIGTADEIEISQRKGEAAELVPVGKSKPKRQREQKGLEVGQERGRTPARILRTDGNMMSGCIPK